MKTPQHEFNRELAKSGKLRFAVNMDCPVCHLPMKRGTTSLEYTFWGAFWAGFSSLTLFFRAPHRERLPIMEPADSRVSFLCRSCEGVFLASPNTSFPSELDGQSDCAECGITLRPGHTDCHWCGWRAETKKGKTCNVHDVF